MNVLDPRTFAESFQTELNLPGNALSPENFDLPKSKPLNKIQVIADMFFREKIFDGEIELLPEKVSSKKDGRKCVVSKESLRNGYGWNASIFSAVVKPFLKAKLKGTLGTVSFEKNRKALMFVGNSVWIVVAPKEISG